MLTYQLLDGNPSPPREGITCFRCSVPVVIVDPEFVSEFCYCFFECKEIMKVFAGEDERTKDYSTLFFQKTGNSDTFTFQIEGKNGIVDLTSDDYGAYKAHSDGISFEYVVDWTKIKTLLGGGYFHLIVEKTVLGIESIEKYGEFQLINFDIEEADGTIKIESYQNGNLEHGYDYRDLNVYQSIRINGIMSLEEPQDTVKNYLDGDRIVKQIQERTHSNHTITFYTNQYKLAQSLFDGYMMADKILVSDYNLTNRRTYNKHWVSRVETSIDENQDSRFAGYNVVVSDSIKNKIKNPYVK